MKTLIRLIKRFASWIDNVNKERCKHPHLSVLCDAWDVEYICKRCGTRWFNEVPKLKREVEWNGEIFALDGVGGINKKI